MRKVTEKDIWIYDNWINVDGVGRIGLYLPSENSIGLDWSMKFIVGTNEKIPCSYSEIKTKIVELFNPKK
jgi:hypothetical protein